MATIDSYNEHLACSEIRIKLDAGAKVIQFLNDDTNSLDSECFGAFVDVVSHTISNSNFKVAQNGLEIFTILAGRMKDGLKPHVSSFFSLTIDRLGDQKDSVREAAKVLLRKLMSDVSTPQLILEKMLPAFNHKIWRVRDETINFLRECLPRFGVVGTTNGQLYVSKFVPVLVGLMSDQNQIVRENSIAALIDLYKHVGERLRKEIATKHLDIPQVKMQLLMNKFDEVAKRGEVSATTNGNYGPASLNGGSSFPSINGVQKVGNRPDITDSAKPRVGTIRGTSAPLRRNAIPPSGAGTNGTGNVAGAADEEMFMQAFEDPNQVPRIQLFGVKDVESEMTKIAKICNDQQQDWEKRTESLRRLRALVIAGATSYDEFYLGLRNLQDPLLISIKDLRSQVVREACITIAYLSVKTENKCDKLMEFLLPDLIGQIQSSAKIMSSSAIVAIRFIIQHSHCSRFIRIITMNLSSKSKEIRRACSEFLGQLLHTWSTHALEKNVDLLQKAIQKGISDADPDARALSRKAFWAFAAKFKAESDQLLSTLDAHKQKMLSDERMSNWSSNSSLNRAPLSMTGAAGRSTYSSRQNSVESLNSKFGTGSRRIPPPSASKPALSYRTPMRTMSNIDLDAQRSVKSKINPYLAQPRPMMTNSVFSTLSMPKRIPPTSSTDSASSSSHFKTPISSHSRVSKSQPGSRSQSPSRQYYSNIGVLPPTASGVRSTVKSRYMTPSRDTSREHSPSSSYRTPVRPGYERRLSNTSSSRSTASAKRSSSSRILTHSDERSIAKSLLQHVTPRKKFTMDNQSDDGSENSSICSDMSFSAYNGRRLESTGRIIEKLRSQGWSDRKEGLANLLAVFRESQSCRELDTVQLKEISDILHRMLNDNQIKSYSLLLTVLNEFIQIYAKQLDYWLYPLMTRLFIKLNNDILGSIQTRIMKTLELIRECFPIVDQFNAIMKMISDTRHSLQNKARTIALQHLSKIIFLMDAIDFTYDKVNNHEISATIRRILYMSSEPKSLELRKLCEDTITNLYLLNDSQMTLYINSLEPMYQDTARQIIDGAHKRKETPNKAPIATPFIFKQQIKSRISSTEGVMNRDQFLDSLKKTTHEIQNFSLNYDANDTFAGAAALMRHIQQDVDNSLSISLDSGISQIDGAGDKIKNGAHNGTPNSINGRSPQSVTSSSRCSNGSTLMNNTVPSETISAEDTLKSFIHEPETMTETDLNALCDIISGLELGEEVCSNLLNTLLAQIVAEQQSSRKVSLLQALNTVLIKSSIDSDKQQCACVESFLQAGKDGDKDVIKTLEETINLAASKFDPKLACDALKGYINSENRSLSTGALNLLQKIVDLHKDAVPELLPVMIPYLLKAYDSSESQVRKSTVFCLVAIHGAIGDELYNHLGSLVPNKVKLLRMYVKRTSNPNETS